MLLSCDKGDGTSDKGEIFYFQDYFCEHDVRPHINVATYYPLEACVLGFSTALTFLAPLLPPALDERPE